MKKKLVKITESDLHRIVKESVKRILIEEFPYMVSAYQDEQLDKYNLQEGWKNWAMAGALGAATMFNPQAANAQNVNTQDYNSLGDVLKAKGKSKKEIKTLSKQFNPSNIMQRNATGPNNKLIYQFLSTLKNPSSSMSTNNIRIFGSQEYDAQRNFLSKFNERNAKKYKLFCLKNGGTVLMPINYTIQNVQNELQPDNTFQLSDFDIQ
jgi:hypothetical protein